MPGRNAFATADHGVVGQLSGVVCRPREGRAQPRRKVCETGKRVTQLRRIVQLRRNPQIAQGSQRSEASRRLGGVGVGVGVGDGAAHAHTVAGQINATHAAAPVGVDARHLLTERVLEIEGASREIGHLRFGAQMNAHRHGVRVGRDSWIFSPSLRQPSNFQAVWIEREMRSAIAHSDLLFRCGPITQF